MMIVGSLFALVLLLLYSGLRIRDAVTLSRDRIVDGKVGMHGDGAGVVESRDTGYALGLCKQGPYFFRVFLFHIENARTKGNARAHDPVCTQKSHAGIIDMHTASPPSVASVRLTPDFGKGWPHRYALGDGVPVTPMGASHVVILAEILANPSRHRLLPDIKMNEPRHDPGTVYLLHLQLEEADPHHGAVQAEREILRKRHVITSRVVIPHIHIRTQPPYLLSLDNSGLDVILPANSRLVGRRARSTKVGQRKKKAAI